MTFSLPAGTEVLGKYRVETGLLQDHRFESYAARHMILNRPVRLCLAAREWTRQAELRQSFADKMRRLVGLRDARLLDVYDVFELDERTLERNDTLTPDDSVRADASSQPWLRLGVVSEVPAQPNLADELARCKPGPWPVRKVQSWLVPALLAVHALHQRQLVHGRLLPSSMARLGEHEVKLVDLVRLRLSGPRLTLPHPPSLDELDVVAPEWIAEPNEVTSSADLYSMGCILFRLLTGRRVFEARDAYSTMVAQLTEKPVAPSTLLAGLHDGLDRIVLRALAKHPRFRFESAEAMADALLNFEKFRSPVPSNVPEWSRALSAAPKAPAVAEPCDAGEGPRAVESPGAQPAPSLEASDAARTESPPPGQSGEVAADAEATNAAQAAQALRSVALPAEESAVRMLQTSEEHASSQAADANPVALHEPEGLQAVGEPPPEPSTAAAELPQSEQLSPEAVLSEHPETPLGKPPSARRGSTQPKPDTLGLDALEPGTGAALRRGQPLQRLRRGLAWVVGMEPRLRLTVGILLALFVASIVALSWALRARLGDTEFSVEHDPEAVAALLGELIPPEGMVLVPGGPSLQGAPPLSLGWEPNQLSSRVLALSSFAIDVREVSQAEFLSRASARVPMARDARADGLPMVDVSWTEAADYCAAVGKRLPTEAEWEKAARGLNEQPFPWGRSLVCGQAAVATPSCEPLPGPLSVDAATGDLSPYGVRGMAGNVWEWVADVYADPNTFDGGERIDPVASASGKGRVIKGGDWNSAARSVAWRAWNAEPTRSPHGGFRCAKSMAPLWRRFDGGVLGLKPSPNQRLEHYLARTRASSSSNLE